MNFCTTDSDSAKIAACASVATFNVQSNTKFSLRFFQLCFMFCGFFPCFVDYEDNLPLTMYKWLCCKKRTNQNYAYDLID